MIADMEKNNWNFYVRSIGDVFAKFQLSRLIYIFLLPFNRCCQLLTADDSCQEKKSFGIFIYPINMILMLNFSSVCCLAAELESVMPPAGRQTSPDPR